MARSGVKCKRLKIHTHVALLFRSEWFSNEKKRRNKIYSLNQLIASIYRLHRWSWLFRWQYFIYEMARLVEFDSYFHLNRLQKTFFFIIVHEHYFWIDMSLYDQSSRMYFFTNKKYTNITIRINYLIEFIVLYGTGIKRNKTEEEETKREEELTYRYVVLQFRTKTWTRADAWIWITYILVGTVQHTEFFYRRLLNIKRCARYSHTHCAHLYKINIRSFIFRTTKLMCVSYPLIILMPGCE